MGSSNSTHYQTDLDYFPSTLQRSYAKPTKNRVEQIIFFLDAPTINSRRETSLFKLTSHRMIVDVLNGKITRINPNSFLVRDFKLELLF